MKNIPEIKFNEIMNIIQEFDNKEQIMPTANIPSLEDITPLQEKLQSCIDTTKMKFVLGIDIYKYSQFKILEQSLIPIIFKLLYDDTVENCLECETYLFQKYNKNDFIQNFISTGDGGFQMFDTPMHGVIFIMYFALNLRNYNSYHFFPKLRKIIGEIDLRYCITQDILYSLRYSDSKNYFGTSIINNARILGKDKLNRFLIDENVYLWFMININGIESLQYLDKNTINTIPDFAEYNEIPEGDYSTIFQEKANQLSNILASDIQKIGEIKSKDTHLSVYNVHIQIKLNNVSEKDPSIKYPVTVTIGNLNISGISET